jgi:hypothetical protein
VVIAGETEKILAATNGWIIPLTRCAHCETLQIFSQGGGLSAKGNKTARGNALGLGLLLGAATFAYFRQKGCTKAEILAINDDGEESRLFTHV